jgi:hypothetical protein
MNNLIVPDEFKRKDPFKLPFSADGDRVVDAECRTIVSIDCDAEQAVRLAKLFASAAESLNRLNSVASMLEASLKDSPDFKHGALDEDIDNCLICYIRHYVKEVLS